MSKNEAAKPKCVGSCVVCPQGKIFEQKVTQFVDHGQPVIIGPGGAGQHQEVVTGYYCDQCGLMYVAPPKVNSNGKGFWHKIK